MIMMYSRQCIECFIRNNCLNLLRKIRERFVDEMYLSSVFMKCLIKCKVDGFENRIKSSIISSYLVISDQNCEFLTKLLSKIFHINDIRVVKIISRKCSRFCVACDPISTSPIRTRLFLYKLYGIDSILY